MKQTVTAVLIAHDEPEYLKVSIAALQAQTRLPEQILLIDTSTNDGCSAIAQAAGIQQIIRLAHKSSLAKIVSEARAHAQDSAWLWLLHDDSAPQPTALENLLLATEISPSVVVAGPKQVDWENPRLVMQQGLTLTPLGDLFSLVRGELDQGQHDDTDDVMAVGTAGALIRVDAFDQLGGFDHRAPALAADFDFSIRARLAGYRVVVVPTAKVAHAGLSLAGQRPRRWLKTSPKAALRRAAIHLRLVYAPLPAALLFWLFLPAIGVVRAIWRIVAKRPDRIWSEISAAVWGFITLPTRLAGRLQKPKVIPFKKLKALRADWTDVRAGARSQLDAQESRAAIEAFNRGGVANTSTVSFVASGGLWFAAALLAVSWAFWPSAVALVGPGSMPLAANWLDLFAKAGTSYQEIGFGFYGPSDPFAWVLVLLGSLTFWAPSLSISLVFLLAKSLAFMGAWRVASLVSQSPIVRILAGLTFALWPSFTAAQTEARVPSVLAIVALPWLVLALARIANLGRVTKSTQQTWSWVALAGLLMVVVGASSPSVTPIMVLAIAVLMAVKWRRAGYLIWAPLPLAAVFGPTVLWHIQLNSVLALLADPGVPLSTQIPEAWQFILGGFNFGAQISGLGQVGLWLVVPAVGLALLAAASKRAGLAASIWAIALVSLAAAWLFAQISFVAVSSGVNQAVESFVAGSPMVLLAVYGLAISVLLALALDQLSSVIARRWAAGVLVTALLPIMAFMGSTVPAIKHTDGRVVPSIVAAEAAQQLALKVLVINPVAQSDGSVDYSAELITGDGVHFEDLSLNYRFALAGQTSEAKEQLSDLVGSLVAANDSDLEGTLFDAGIGYILVPQAQSSARADLAINLNSVKELEAVGETDFGGLWRVAKPNTAAIAEPVDASGLWSITKGVQAAILAGFVLLALPTSAGRRRKSAAESSIFVEAGEEL